jgi:hypothetical protein
VSIFSQRDPRWARQKVGTGTLTIGRVGCLLTCVASVLTDLDVDTDPRRLNTWLTANHGYASDNLFVFKSVQPLGVKLATLIFCPTTPAPLDTIKAGFAAGQECIVEVDFQPGGKVEQHWVRLLDETTIADPWQLPGQEVIPLAHYGLPNWDAARSILAVVLYTAASDPAPRMVQPQLCVR